MNPNDLAILQISILRLVTDRTRLAFNEKLSRADRIAADRSPSYVVQLLLESVSEAAILVQKSLESQVKSIPTNKN